MNEPRLIVVTYNDLKAFIRGENHYIPADDLALLPPMTIDEDDNVEVNLEETGWSWVDLEDPETPGLAGGHCSRCAVQKEWRPGHEWVLVLKATVRLKKDEVTLVVVGDAYCSYCQSRHFSRPLIEKPSRWVLDVNVGPCEKIPTPKDVQQRLWDEIQDYSLVGHTILYSGPPGFGKTTMAAKLLQMTSRSYFQRGFSAAFPPCSPPIWLINIPEWIDSMMRYRTRNFDSAETVEPPAVTSNTVREWADEYLESQRTDGKEMSDKNHYPPVLFLEELDKFSASETTNKWLFGLLNAVRAEGGAVISTTNLTPVQLKKHLGAPLYRRVIESNVDGEERTRVLSYPPKK